MYRGTPRCGRNGDKNFFFSTLRPTTFSEATEPFSTANARYLYHFIEQKAERQCDNKQPEPVDTSLGRLAPAKLLEMWQVGIDKVPDDYVVPHIKTIREQP